MTETTPTITIKFDELIGKINPGSVEIPAGEWIVKDLKTFLGVDPAKVLAKIEPMGISDLPDAGTITLKDGDRFMQHARPGKHS